MLASRSLLILDSDPDIRMTYEYILGKIGFDVYSAKDGEEALKICLEERPRVVLSEIMLPGMNGYDLCKRLKGDPVTQYATKFFIFTARAESEVLLKGPQVCADFYVAKPADVNDVAADLYLLFECEMDLAPDQRCRLRVTKPIPSSRESRYVGYSDDNRTAVHLNPPAVSASDGGFGSNRSPQAAVATASGQAVVMEAPKTGLAEVNQLLASLSGSFEQTLTRLNAVIEYIERVQRR
ncbi:MAG: response regulator [Candidatus Omnitrophica bacterium]|nr:response regulator [Candidatus Omnitrophota bacterium]